GDALTAVKVSDPAHGSVTVNADGSFTYTPTPGYTGADSFTYKASDGTDFSNAATVSIAVSNDAPAAADDGDYAAPKNAQLVVGPPGLPANRTADHGDALTAVKVSDPPHGTVTVNADGSFTYTPTPGFVGTDSFTYKASDGTDFSNAATVLITVTPNN